MTGTTATTTPSTDQTNPRTTAIRQGRQADSARRRQRVIAVLGRAHTDGTEISASGIARAAGVDRSFLYRHRDLLEKIHALEATPPALGDTLGPAVTHIPCMPTCWPPANAPNASTAGFSNSKSDCPKCSAKKPGRNQVSALLPTSTLSTRPSVTSNSRSSTYACNWTNATRTSPPRAPPTANSSPNSTPPHDTSDTPNRVLHNTCRAR